MDDLLIFWWTWTWASIWQTAFLGLIIWALDAVLRARVYPQVRFALWSLVLLKFVLSPFFFSPLSITAPYLVEGSVPYILLSGSAMAEHAMLGTRFIEGALWHGVMLTQADAAPIWLGAAAVIWAAVAALLLVTYGRRLRTISAAIEVEADHPLPDHVLPLAEEVAAELRLKRLPRFVVTRYYRVPAVFGLRRPVILLPEPMLERFSETDLRNILRHEFAHIRRGDLLFKHLLLIVQMLNWFNPVAYILRRRMVALQEMCCDMAAVRNMADQRSYRRTLLKSAEYLTRRSGLTTVAAFGFFGQPDSVITRLRWLERDLTRVRMLDYGIPIAIFMTLLKIFVFPMG